MSNGNREMSNDYLMDGVDDNFRRNALITLRPTVEDILEFKIQTNLFGPEQGRNSGATVNVITKSGATQLHGSLFEFSCAIMTLLTPGTSSTRSGIPTT